MNLNQVTIYSAKPMESIEFYKKLGLHLIVDSAPRYVRFECPNGDSTFSIHETDADSGCSKIVLYFECENLDEEVKRLKEPGSGARLICKTPMAIKSSSFTRERIAKIRRGE
jgi:catechol 2,3-dioxygenase-like lactoylglutathione lyase family enzyme